MSKITVCDVCGEPVEQSGRYELIYKCILRSEKEDICYECMEKIKSSIKKNNKQ